jgi:antitoxin FitA
MQSRFKAFTPTRGGPRQLCICLAFFASSAIIESMATLTIRQLDQKTKTRLRVRAAHHGRSMEEEAREILRCALTASSPIPQNLAESIRRRFARFGGIELPRIERDALRDVPSFDE